MAFDSSFTQDQVRIASDHAYALIKASLPILNPSSLPIHPSSSLPTYPINPSI